jgi:hypothetical protein
LKPVPRPTTKNLSRTAATDGYRLAIQGNIEFAGTVWAAYPVSVCVSTFIDVHSLGDVRSLGHSATLDAEAARIVPTEHSMIASTYVIYISAFLTTKCAYQQLLERRVRSLFDRQTSRFARLGYEMQVRHTIGDQN